MCIIAVSTSFYLTAIRKIKLIKYKQLIISQFLFDGYLTKQNNNMKTKTLFNRYTPAFASLLLAAVLFTGCVQDAKESVQNGNFTVEFLFEQNGCKMYRFKDGGRYVYWSDCQGKVQSDYSTQSGKTRVTVTSE